MPGLSQKHILIFAGDDYEDLELWYPKLRLIEAGVKVTVAGLAGPASKCVSKHGYPCVTDASVAHLKSTDFDGAIYPGGWMPDKLRRDAKVLSLTRELSAAGKLISAICHGGWMPISAGVYQGVNVTGSPGIKDDLVNAGAIWHDQPVVIDRHFVSSRKPDDLPEFCKGIFSVLSK
ncbi:MAG: type 1 glutamine amidotransferase [Phycisphaeraceae bacterium]|nr:type 1 glutamine amidotransferase [Phycisphaeraceae bacterium]